MVWNNFFFFCVCFNFFKALTGQNSFLFSLPNLTNCGFAPEHLEDFISIVTWVFSILMFFHNKSVYLSKHNFFAHSSSFNRKHPQNARTETAQVAFLVKFLCCEFFSQVFSFFRLVR